MPHLKELQKKHEKDGLVILGIHTTNGAEKCAAFVKEQGITWPIATDVEKKTVSAFGIDSFPDYTLIDRSGKVRFNDLANSELDRAIALLLAESAPKGDGPSEKSTSRPAEPR